MSKNEYCCDCDMVHSDMVEHVRGEMLKDAQFCLISNYFKTLADPTRIRIVWALLNHEMCVCDLANLLSMTKSAIYHQLRELRINNIVKSRRDGKTIYYSLYDEHVSKFVKITLEHIME